MKVISIGNRAADKFQDDGEEVEAEADDILTNESDTAPVSCYSRFWYEIKSPCWFDLTEPNGVIIDVEATFARTEPIWWCTILIRVVFFGLSLSVLINTIVDYPKDNLFIYFGYITHWMMVFALVYQLVACVITSIYRRALKQPEASSHVLQRPTFLVRFMWGLYSVVAPGYLIVILMYWLLVYDPDKSNVDFNNVMRHGGIAALIWIDGLVVSVIPVRVRHFAFYASVVILAIVWTVAHDFSGIGDGDWPDEDPNDSAEDSLYSSLSWSTNPVGAAVTSVMVIFVACPLTFMIFWAASLWSSCCTLDGGRRRIVMQQVKGEDSVVDETYM